MSEQQPKAMELSTEELEAVAGGAVSISDIESKFTEEALAEAEVFENGGDGTKFASESLTKKTISIGNVDKRLEV